MSETEIEVFSNERMADLTYWLLMDSWSFEEACQIFCEINPMFVKIGSDNEIKSFFQFDCHFYHHEGKGDDGLDGFWDRHSRLKRTKRLLANKNINEMSPKEWIIRAKAKQLDTSKIEIATAYLDCFNDKPPLSLDEDKYKPLSNKERNTLLTIIAALAIEAKIDITKTSKAGELIANMTDILGASISATTIENKLKEIPNALESRAK